MAFFFNSYTNAKTPEILSSESHHVLKLDVSIPKDLVWLKETGTIQTELQSEGNSVKS